MEMNTALWILQGLVAFMFALSGLLKIGRSKEDLKNMEEGMSWVDSLSGPQVKIIGTVELLAAIGLVLPHMTGIQPWLTPLAAAGLILTMMGAMILHIRRRDGAKPIMRNIILLLLATFVAFGRFVLVPA